MKQTTDNERLDEILAAHRLWLAYEPTGIRADLRSADLSGADLSGADLTGADLSNADLRRADLTGADLSNANLYNADLTGADLRGAYLSGAILYNAYLTGADLSGADLRGAYLSGAILYNAYLTGADLAGAELSGADLTGATLPEGWLWWQGGASGPHRRQTYVWRPGADAETYASQGCIRGTPAQVRVMLAERRNAWASDAWAAKHGYDNLWLAESLDALDTGVRYIERRAALTP